MNKPLNKRFSNFSGYLSWQSFIILCLIIIFGILRVRAYQDSLSIGTADSNVFIINSGIPTFSWEFFTSSRPLTVTLIYKLLEPATGYHLTDVVWAWLGTAPDRVYQSGLDRIALAQSAISILCWSLLAWVVARYLRHLASKIIGTVLILAFAYSPQLTDWDGVLMSESLSFSLFALLLALSIDLTFRIMREGKKATRYTYGVAGLWVTTFALWVFSRDTNAYFMLYTALLLILLIVLPITRKVLPVRMITIICGLLAVLFSLQNMSLRNSDRWINPLLNNILKNVLPYPDRLDYFEAKGMPVSDELLVYINSHGNEEGFWEIEPFITWVRQRGFSTYTIFLIEHPLWSVQRLFGNLESMFVGNRQPYFRGTPVSTPLWMIPIGDVLHPRFGGVVWINFVLIIFLSGLSIYAFKRKHQAGHRMRNDADEFIIGVNNRAGSVKGLLVWPGIFLWLYFGELVLLFVSFHGDALGILRHALVAVMPLRLSLWLMSVVILDTMISLIRGVQAANWKQLKKF